MSNQSNATIKLCLKVARGAETGTVFELEEGSNLIGRWDPDGASFPEIDLEACDVEAKVSRKHAFVHIAGQKITIEDIGSLNGTFINKTEQVMPGTKRDIKIGDEIMIGGVFLVLEKVA